MSSHQSLSFSDSTPLLSASPSCKTPESGWQFNGKVVQCLSSVCEWECGPLSVGPRGPERQSKADFKIHKYSATVLFLPLVLCCLAGRERARS